MLLAMDTYLLFAHGGIVLFLFIRAIYFDDRLKRHIDRRYPKEGMVIRSYQWQIYPWSVGRKTLRALIKKQGGSDPELAHLAKKAKRALIYLLVLPIVIFMIL